MDGGPIGRLFDRASDGRPQDERDWRRCHSRSPRRRTTSWDGPSRARLRNVALPERFLRVSRPQDCERARADRITTANRAIVVSESSLLERELTPLDARSGSVSRRSSFSFALTFPSLFDRSQSNGSTGRAVGDPLSDGRSESSGVNWVVAREISAFEPFHPGSNVSEFGIRAGLTHAERPLEPLNVDAQPAVGSAYKQFQCHLAVVCHRVWLEESSTDTIEDRIIGPESEREGDRIDGRRGGRSRGGRRRR